MNIKNNGRLKKIRCPFHSDKTPSFVIYPDTNSYHCFGCNAHGQGAIDFVLESGCSFVEAINELKGLI